MHSPKSPVWKQASRHANKTIVDAECDRPYTGNRYRMALSKHDVNNRFEYRDLYSGLIRLHILHHAVEGPIFGLEMAEELARHGYRISLGTLYPLLHGLEKKGYLRSAEKRQGQSIRKVYRATQLGRKALQAMKVKVSELFGELNESRRVE